MRQFNKQILKLGLFVTVLGSASSHAQLQLNDTELLKCRVIKINSRMNSFIPPKIGDTTEIDLSKDSIDGMIHFKGSSPNANIPIATDNFKLEKIKNASQWTSHMRFYESANVDASGRAAYQMQMVVGAYGNGNEPIEKQQWLVKIQIASTAKESHWFIEQAELACDVIHL